MFSLPSHYFGDAFPFDCQSPYRLAKSFPFPFWLIGLIGGTTGKSSKGFDEMCDCWCVTFNRCLITCFKTCFVSISIWLARFLKPTPVSTAVLVQCSSLRVVMQVTSNWLIHATTRTYHKNTRRIPKLCTSWNYHTIELLNRWMTLLLHLGEVDHISTPTKFIIKFIRCHS